MQPSNPACSSRVTVLMCAWLLAMHLAGCCFAPRAPAPATREHQLDDLGLALTLPGNYGGGQVGRIYIFQSPASEHVLSIDQGPAGIETSEAGLRAFHDQRVGVDTEWTRPMRFGPYDGFAAGGLERGSTTRQHWNGLFAGPRGTVRIELISTAQPTPSDTVWTSTCATLRPL